MNTIPLYRFQVIGWDRDRTVKVPSSKEATPKQIAEIKAISRKPMKAEKIDAPNETSAIQHYARTNQLKPVLWNDGSPNPQIIIRAVQISPKGKPVNAKIQP